MFAQQSLVYPTTLKKDFFFKISIGIIAIPIVVFFLYDIGLQARKQFDILFRNLVDGLVKGHAKPGKNLASRDLDCTVINTFDLTASFKLTRANLFPDNGNVFDYTLDQKGDTKPLHWLRKRKGMFLTQVVHLLGLDKPPIIH